MSGDENSITSLTLLGRLGTSTRDEDAWREFVARYGNRIERWCRKWGLQASDAQDVTQNVLLQLSKQIQHFQYKPSGKFRSWLKTVAYRAWCDFLESRQGKPIGSGDTGVVEMLQSVKARDDLLQHLEEEFDCELLEEAVRCVKSRVQDHTWEAYRLMAIDGLSGAETANRLQMNAGAVFVARSKVEKMLREEVQRLEVSDDV